MSASSQREKMLARLTGERPCLVGESRYDLGVVDVEGEVCHVGGTALRPDSAADVGERQLIPHESLGSGLDIEGDVARDEDHGLWDVGA